MTSLRLVSGRVARVPDETHAEVVLRSQRVVRSAAKREIGQRVLAALREGLQMVELEVMRFSAALPGVVEVCAAALIAFEDGAPDRGGDASSALARAREARCALGRRAGDRAAGRGARFLS